MCDTSSAECHTEPVHYNNGNAVDIETQHEITPAAQEAQLRNSCRYQVEELLKLRYAANMPLDHLNFSEEAPVGKSFMILVFASTFANIPLRLWWRCCIEC